jgi:hypothetical protein
MKMKVDGYKENIIIERNMSKKPIKNRILIGTPTLGIFRAEWAQARYGQVVPCNWTMVGAMSGYTHMYPLGYLVADAQNIIVHAAVQEKFEWLFLLEDDVIMPNDCFLKLNEYMKAGDVPVVSGLYFLKGSPSEPLAYRGRGNGCYDQFNIGDKVWVDGVPTGCLLIHCSVLNLMYEESETYQTGSGQTVKKVFETPSKLFYDPETNEARVAQGTSDLYWCDRIMKENVFARSGWSKYAKKEFPFLLDTSIFCKHIDLNLGMQYPLGEIKDANLHPKKGVK